MQDHLLSCGIFPLHILVRQIEPGIRMRTLVALKADFTDCDEDRAKALSDELLASDPTILVDARALAVHRRAKKKRGRK